jgi:hypothetical protein
MIAAAPGACGSLVIFNSSGETGWNPMPALAVFGQQAITIRTIVRNENAESKGRKGANLIRMLQQQTLGGLYNEELWIDNKIG